MVFELEQENVDRIVRGDHKEVPVAGRRVVVEHIVAGDVVERAARVEAEIEIEVDCSPASEQI